MKINKVAFQAEGFILFHMVLCFSAARILGGKQGKIGFEIESHSPFLINRELTMDEKLKLKGHRIIGHEDPDGKWFLGVDSTPPYGPILDFEYDLLVPLEGGKVADAAQGLVNDIVSVLLHSGRR